MTIRLRSPVRPICFISAYLPCRSGCTDVFKEPLDFVDSTLGQLCFDSDVFILGDLNADPGHLGGPNATTSVNEQGRILVRYLSRWNYVSVHLHTCSTPTSHTYTSEAHASCSTIDHILSPVHLLPSFSHCKVRIDEPLNLSDHSPLCAILSCCLDPLAMPTKSNNVPFRRLNWSKLSKEELLKGYTMAAERNLRKLSLPELSSLTSSSSLIDSLLSKVTSTLTATASEHVPLKHFRAHLKPRWNRELRCAHSRSKKAYKAWVAVGRPRYSSHPRRRCYKLAKAAFRALLRKHQKEQRDTFYRELDLDCVDSRKLFRHIRRNEWCCWGNHLTS